MRNTRFELRVDHVLGRHIECLQECGAALTGRSPNTLTFEGRTLTVQNGKLRSELGIRDFIAVIASYSWPNSRLRDVAIETCLQQVDEPIGCIPFALPER